MQTFLATLRHLVAGEMGKAAQKRRRVGLGLTLVLILALTLVDPTARSEAITSGQIGIALFAALLTGGAIIFGLSFSSSTLWPSLKEINEYVGVSDWVTIASLGTLSLGIGAMINSDLMESSGTVVVIFGDLIGLASFLRILSLASPDRRKLALGQRLGEEFAYAATQSDRPALAAHKEIGVLHRFITEFESTLTRGDPTALADLVDEVEAAAVSISDGKRALHLARPSRHLPNELSFYLLHRITQRALSGGLDSRGASELQTKLANSLIAATSEPSDGVDDTEASTILGRLSLYLGWTTSTAWSLAARESLQTTAARSLIVSSNDLRGKILRTVDPDPSGILDPEQRSLRPISTPLGCLCWLRGFVEFHGTPMTVALYPTFQLLSGERFSQNIWDGAPILANLRHLLYIDNSDTSEASITRSAVGTVSDFDRTLLALSVGFLSTLRDFRMGSSVMIGLPNPSSEPRRLAYELWPFATHRYFSTATDALETLARYSTQRLPNDLWRRSGAALSRLATPGPPIIEPTSRMAALGLAIALRLAPLRSSDSIKELHNFLSRLDPGYLHAIRLLTDRVLPPTTAKAPINAIIEQLSILHLMPYPESFLL